MAFSQRDHDNCLPTKWPVICQCNLYNSLPHEVYGKKAFLHHKQCWILTQQFRLVHGRAPTPPEAYDSENDRQELRSGAEDATPTRVLGWWELYKHKPNIDDFSDKEDSESEENELAKLNILRGCSSEGNVERGDSISDCEGNGKRDIDIDTDDLSISDNIRQ